MKKFIAVSFLFAIFLISCGGATTQAPNVQGEVSELAPATESSQIETESTAENSSETGEASPEEANLLLAERENPDLTNLPIGNDFISSSAQAGYLWSCQSNFSGSGPDQTGAWYDEAGGTWDFTIKPVVDGNVVWTHEFMQSVAGDAREFTANGLPFHSTGNFPISSADDAYQFDRNPNAISEQNYSLSLPANPSLAANPSCVGGEVGIAISGAVIFNALDALGRDAVATEIQDSCQGHPQQSGVYHYHGYSDCLEEEGLGHSELVGWALDGFGIFGPYGETGNVIHNEDLDICHGESHTIDWDGERIEMYHYHMSFEFPYSLGCYRGSAQSWRPGSDNSTNEGAETGGNSIEGVEAGGNNNAGGPPQEAINACSGLSAGTSCSISPPNGGSITGVCTDLQGQVACVPSGPPPN